MKFMDELCIYALNADAERSRLKSPSPCITFFMRSLTKKTNERTNERANP